MRRALAASVMFHALVLLWVATRPERTMPTGSQAIEVQVVALPPPIKPPPTPTPEPSAPPERRRTVARPTPPPAEPPPPKADAPLDAPTADAPMAHAPTLTPSLLPSLTDPNALGMTAPTYDGGTVQTLERSPQAMVSALAKETLGRGRVERGLVHPYYVKLGKALVKQWDADRAVRSHGLKGYLNQTVENTRIYNSIWQERAQAYAKGGSPFADAPYVPMQIQNDRVPYGSGVDLAARQAARREMSKDFRATKQALIRVVQSLDGHLLRVELVQPSNDASIDKEALADVRAAAEQLPPPPEEATVDKTELSSIWQFELVVSITPPVPTFTFEFDEALGFIDARLPLDRRIYKKVKLVSVE